MTRQTLFTTALFAIGLCVASATPSSAQHRDRHGVATHRSGISIQLFSPRGQPVIREHHDDYRYVVPSTPRHGAYYNYEDRHYFTPPAPPVVINQPVVVQRPVPIEFGAFKHQEQLAERLETLANQFCLDLHYNYRHNRNFAEAYREAYQLLQAVKYVHGSEHRGDRNAIRKSVTSIDNLFHHVQEEVSDWTRVDSRRVGDYSLLAKTEELQALIHHLMFDVGVKPDHDREEQAPPPAGAAPAPR